MTNYDNSFWKFDGDDCPVPACDGGIVFKDHSMTCGSCWNVIASRCRGKAVMTYVQAQLWQQRHGSGNMRHDQRQLVAYECGVCDGWHTGGSVPDAAERHRIAVSVREYLISARGQQWYDRMVNINWRREAGVYSRSSQWA